MCLERGSRAGISCEQVRPGAVRPLPAPPFQPVPSTDIYSTYEQLISRRGFHHCICPSSNHSCTLMHQPRCPRTVWSMKFGAWLFFLLGLNTVVTILVILTALAMASQQLLVLTLALLTFGLVLLISFRVVASGARCPLCSGSVLLSRRCQRSRHAVRSFGSYRIRVARDIILCNSFRCSYCGESTHCSPRASRDGNT